MCESYPQGKCPHQSNPIDDRARERLAEAEDIISRYPAIARDLPDLASELTAWDAQVDASGYRSTEAAGLKTF